MNLKRVAKILEDTNDLKVRQIILDTAQKKGQIVYGARALNRQLPTYLRKETKDYDILTKRPKKSAVELSKQLKRHTREEVTVVKAKHKGTYKVKIGGKTIVDYTQLRRLPKTKASWGNQLYDIKSIKRNLQRSLKQKKNEFRRLKDLDSFDRIKMSEDTFNF